ncbi:MAG: DUF6677 family protein [Candidatus Acidiferrales bacterium]
MDEIAANKPSEGEIAPIDRRAPRGRASSEAYAVIIALAGWAVPGLGHLLVRRWGRAIIFFCAVGGLAVAGYWMRGEVFMPRSQQPFGTLGFVADAASGMFYFLAHVFESAGPDLSQAAGNYGSRFIAAAGIVNLVAILDACEIAAGRRI